jgi:hypothetical protein
MKVNESALNKKRAVVEKKLARFGVNVDWSKLSGTAYEDNPKLLLDEFLLVRKTLGEIAGSTVPSSDDWLGSVDSGDTGLLIDEEMRGLGML